MGPWDDGGGGDTGDGFWTSLTETILGGAGRYFEGQLTADTKVKLAATISSAIGNIVKFVVVVLVIGGILSVVLKRK